MHVMLSVAEVPRWQRSAGRRSCQHGRGAQVRHELLNLMDFTSERARMSVIARSPDGTIRLFCKGADTKARRRGALGPVAVGGHRGLCRPLHSSPLYITCMRTGIRTALPAGFRKPGKA